MASSSKSSSQGQNNQQTFVDPAQTPFLDRLRRGAEGAFAGMPDYSGVFDRASAGADRVGGMQFQDPRAAYGAARTGFQNFRGANPYTDQLGAYANRMFQGSSPGVEGVIGNLGEDINRQLQRMLGGAGGVNTQSALSGTLGGGRNEVSTGIAQEGALNTFGTQAGQIRLNDYQTRQAQGLQALESAGGMYGAGQGQDLAALSGLAGVGGGELAGGVANAGAAGEAATAAQGLAMSPFQGQLGLYEQLARVLGTPTVLGRDQGTNKSNSSGFSIFNMGAGGGE